MTVRQSLEGEKYAGSSPACALCICHRFFLFLSLTYSLAENFPSVNNEIVSEISRGLMVLVGIGVGKCHSTHCTPV